MIVICTVKTSVKIRRAALEKFTLKNHIFCCVECIRARQTVHTVTTMHAICTQNGQINQNTLNSIPMLFLCLEANNIQLNKT